MKRLVESDATEVERALIESTFDDRPPDSRGRARTLSALATAGLIGGTAQEAAAAGATGGLVAKLVGSFWTKALAVASVGTGLSWAGYEVLGNQGATTPQTPPAASRPAPAAAATPAPRPSVAPQPAPAPVPSVAPKPAAAREAVPTPPTKKAQPSQLQRELSMLRSVRSKMNAGDYAAAEHALDAYNHEFKKGILALEAPVLRVQILLKSGRRAEAEALASRYTRNNPNGSYSKRLRRLVFGADAGAQ